MPELYASLDQKEFFSLSELASLCRVKPATVFYWFQTGSIDPCARTSRRGKYRIPRDQVVSILKRRGVEVKGLWTPRRTILVVDNFVPIAKFIRAVFDYSRVPADVLSAKSVADGLVEAGRTKPDLIFLDYGFPASQLQGVQALEAIRAARLLKGVRVIGMATLPGALSKMRQAGASDVLLKPFGHREVLSAASRVLRIDVPAELSNCPTSTNRLRFPLERPRKQTNSGAVSLVVR